MPYDIIIGRDESDKKKFGDKGIIYIGKGYVKMGNYTSLSNKIWMDIARNHVVLVCGKRGSGKCLHGDTLITLADGSQIPIKDLENNKERVLSLNEKLKMEQSEKSDFFSRKVSKLLKLKLRSGKEIKLTPEHPLLTIKGWEEAQKIGIGGRIATPRKLNCPGSKEMPEHEIKLLAYMIAEGHTKKIALFANTDEKIVGEFRESLKVLDPTLELIKDKESHYRISSPNWRSKVLEHDNSRNERGQFLKGKKNTYEKRSIRKLLERENLLGLLSTQKYLPQNIMQLKRDKLAIFLNRLFSCDGTIYKTNNYWQSGYCSSSEKMIRQVQNLLLRFGVLSKLRDKKIKLNKKVFTSYELVINSQNTLKFIEEIGFFGRKAEKGELAKREISKKLQNPNVDTIPKEVWQIYLPRNWTELGRQLGYSHPKAMRERVYYSPSRQTLSQIAAIEQSNPLQLLAQSDIFWDEIVSIELLEGEFKVYDICVPGSHNFVANDIIVHNSYSLGAIAEELSNLPPENAKNISSLMFDTMGIFWTMKYKNEKDKELLEQWDLKPKELPVRVFVPFGKVEDYKKKGIPVDATFAIEPSELDAEEWLAVFKLQMTEPIGVAITKAISELKKRNSKFDLADVQAEIGKDDKSSHEVKNTAQALFRAADEWGVFAGKSIEGISVSELLTPATTNIIDISVYSSISVFNVRALVISIISRKVFKSRMDARKKEEIEAVRHGQEYLAYKSQRQEPLVWIFIDEGHEFLPKEGKTPATDALIQLLREGRQPGISMVMATQQPGQIHHDVMTQSDIIISHRITAKPDIDALNLIMQTYLLETITKQMNELPSLKGSAILLDDNSERIYPIRVRPKYTWHGGESPVSIKAELEI